MRFLRAINQACLVGTMLALPSCLGGPEGEGPNASAPLNWRLPTMGGNQFWTDVQHRSGWRIQRHFATGHFRLLDTGNSRQAWGTLKNCEAALASKSHSMPRNQDTVLILVHGLARTAHCWGPMTEYVQAESNWQVIPYTYASTRKSICDHAAALDQLIRSLGSEVKAIHFAGHSLGNIVIRHYLADTRLDPEPRIGRFVMIGPPNHGSRMARVLFPTILFPLIAGPSGVSLGWGWSDLEHRLATPRCQFGIIAGGHLDNRQGLNPILSGTSDGTVSLSEAILPGASDLMVQPLFHSTMMKHPDVCRATLKFLRAGSFAEDVVERLGADELR